MKLVFNKKLEGGKYFVEINVGSFSPEEIDNMKRFGPPNISIEPRAVFSRTLGRSVRSLPLHDLNYNFQFDNDIDANDFIKQMTGRIKAAVTNLKSHKDSFSGSQELEF